MEQKQIRWLSEEIVTVILDKAADEMRKQTYSMSKVSRQSLQVLLKKKQQVVQIKNLQEQIIHLCSVIGGMPKYFICLLDNEEIISHSHIQTINSKNQHVAHQLFRDVAALNKVNQLQMPNYLSHKTIYASTYRLVNLAAQKIVEVYEQCSALFKQGLKELTQSIKASKIMNNFLLFKIFREIAQNFKKICFQKAVESVFRNCEQNVLQDFFKFLINKFQNIKLFYNAEIFDGEVYQPSQILLLQKLQNHAQIEMDLKQVINSQGKFAIFIKNTSQNKQIQKTLQDYILILDDRQKLQLANCKTLRKKWLVMGDLKTKVKLSVMAKDYIVEGQEHFDNLIKERKQQIQKIIPFGQALEMHTNYNGIVGRSLYMMKRYSGVNAFFLDLSKRAVLIKSMEELTHQLPILGYMILAGTFSIKFYQILTNKFSTSQGKLKDMLGVMIGATTTVGSSLLGAMTGQILIPIPIFGALIGGVIGGFIGDKGGKHINSWMTKKKFLRLIQYLKQQQKQKIYWVWSEEFYALLQIKQNQVRKAIPQYMQDFIFATMVAFILICFYQSKRLIQYNQQKLTTQKSKKSYQKIKSIKNQRQFQQQLKTISFQQDFQTSFDLMKIIQFLEQKNVCVYHHYASFEKSILVFLSKIIN